MAEMEEVQRTAQDLPAPVPEMHAIDACGPTTCLSLSLWGWPDASALNASVHLYDTSASLMA